MQDLIEHVFRPAFGNPLLDQRHDGAVFETEGGRLAFTTDSYVVRPLFFPGGNIGDLAVYGTINDLAMCGAQPLALSAGFILEEGLPMDTLRRVVASMAEAARRAGVPIVTGDTKVVDRGKGDGLYVNTAGVGRVRAPRPIGPREIQPGDAILLSGDIGRHGTAIMAAREGIQFDAEIDSDCAPVHEAVLRLIEAGVAIRCLRDCTRGGLAAALIEIARDRRLRLHIEGRAVPVRETVRGACEMLGLDPLYVANEGRFVAIVDAADAERALGLIGPDAVRIGAVTDEPRGMLTLTSEIGATRVVDLLSGEQLPRIC
jgi:hydrogenase expression/formation protein HypE